jgi:hypothetical protein
VTRTLSRLHRIAAGLIDEWTPLRLTLIILLLRPPGEGTLRGLTWLAAALALALPPLARSSLLWLTLAGLVFARVVADWPLADNHIYLLGYWCLGLGLCLGLAGRGRPVAAIASMSRYLAGCTFLCAIVWKGVLAPDYLDARFFRVTLITDERFAGVARAIGGLTDTQLRDNRAALEPLPAGAELLDGPVLVEPRALRVLGLALTWGGLILETALAWAFLIGRPSVLHRGRHLLLAAFAALTYAAAPVAGFGWLLAAMGLAQCHRRQHALRLMYVGAFVLITIYAETPLVTALLRALSP